MTPSCLYILRMYTGLKNKEIGELFGVSLSAVNKEALRVSIQGKERKHIRRRIEENVPSALKV